MPYSTLIALTCAEIRETPVDDMDDYDLEVDSAEPSDSGDSAAENVVICDTQVILRINPDKPELKSNNKRMTRRLLNSSEAFKETQQHKTQQLPKLPKRKDLCKLLGLNEQDVDLCIVPEVKVAQKVALSHSSELSMTNAETVKNTAKKKDLAKFLGVEEDQTPQAIQDSTPIKSTAEIRVRKNDPSPSSALNFIKMVKTSVQKASAWKSENQHSDIEMDVPVQLRQVPAKEPTERTHRKDLSKFLGFDDSDSEEIVFIRNANPNQVETSNSSLTRKSMIEVLSTSAETATTENEDAESDDSVGSLRSFDSFVRRSLRCGASSEFAIQIEEGATQQLSQHKTQQQSLVTLDRKTSRNLPSKHKNVAFGPNSRRMISPIRSRRRRQISAAEQSMPPVFLREEPLLVYPQKPPLFYQHYPMYASYGILSGPPPQPVPAGQQGPRINPSNGRVRFPRQQAKRPQMNG